MQAERAAVFAWQQGNHRGLHPLSGYAVRAGARLAKHLAALLPGEKGKCIWSAKAGVGVKSQ